jgi:ABC-type multidrug transport system permease subunit
LSFFFCFFFLCFFFFVLFFFVLCTLYVPSKFLGLYILQKTRSVFCF